MGVSFYIIWYIIIFKNPVSFILVGIIKIFKINLTKSLVFLKQILLNNSMVSAP